MLAHQIQLTYKTNMMLTGKKKNHAFPLKSGKKVYFLSSRLFNFILNVPIKTIEQERFKQKHSD